MSVFPRNSSNASPFTRSCRHNVEIVVEQEFVVGGLSLPAAAGRTSAVGEYVEVDPPRRVVFTFGWEDDEVVPPGSSTIEITLEPSGSGTLVRLEHSGLPEDRTAQHGEGWVHYLERLEVAATGGDPGPDPWAQPVE